MTMFFDPGLPPWVFYGMWFVTGFLAGFAVGVFVMDRARKKERQKELYRGTLFEGRVTWKDE